MSDSDLSSSSELSSSEESKSSSPKKAQKRKLTDSSSRDNEKKEIKKCKVQTESLDRNGNDKKVEKPQFVGETAASTTNSDGAFQNFMKRCLERRSDSDTKKVLEKLQKLYNKLSSCHKTDDKFKSYVVACHEKITKNITKDIYTPILELRTEIKNRLQTKLEDEATSSTGVDVQEVSAEKKRQIEQLEETIKKCRLKIKELQDKEVDFDEDQDSAYIQEDKYKKKLVQLCKYLSELTGDTEMRKQIFKKKIRRKDIPGDMTGNSLLDEAVISLINSHIGKINKFRYLETEACPDLIKMPDYVDVLQCIQKSNTDNNLDLSEEKITKLAKRAFKDLGHFLKNKRINDSEWYIQSLLPDESEDPAEKDVELQKKLQNNKTEGDKRLQAIFKKYLDKQDGLDEEDAEEKTDDEGSSDDENKDEDETVHLNSVRKNESSKDEKEKSNRKKKEILETNTTAKTSFIHVHQMLKSDKKLEDKSDTDTAIKCKETLKDNTVAKSTSKFQEAVEKNTNKELTSKETVKGNTIAIPKSQEVVSNNTTAEPASKSKERVKDNAVMETARKSKETFKNKADTERTSKSKEHAKDKKVTETALKSKETLKTNADTERAPKSKEHVKDKKVTETALNSKETLKDKAGSERTSKSKEPAKDKKVTETALKSKETLKTNADTERAPKSKEHVKDKKVTETALNSKETLKHKAGSERTSKSKEPVKDKKVTETVLKPKETLKTNTDTERAPKSKEHVKDKKMTETALKSKEALKNNADRERAPKPKEPVKDDIVAKATSKSQEDVIVNVTTKPALTSKEVVKVNTVIETEKSKETLKNTVEKTTLECSNSKNSIINEKKENFGKSAQINNKEEDDDDVIIIDSSDDDCAEVEKPRDIQKTSERNLSSICTKTQSKRVVKVDSNSFQSVSPAITSTPKTVPRDISPKKLVDVTGADNSQVKMTFLKVRDFAKSPPAWRDDGSIKQSSWLSDR